jgi:hypothetical protein
LIGFVIIMIGNVPQGLPTTITACLYIIAERMGKHNVFVKKLDIIETLGSCTCICTDKTGTLTQNLMTVANTWVFQSKLTNKEYVEKIKNDISTMNQLPIQMRTLLEIAALNSRVAMEMKPSKEDAKVEIWTPTGDATELGLYRFCDLCVQAKTSRGLEEYRKVNHKLHEIPFNSSNKWQMSIHMMDEQNGKQIMFVKGAPDVLLDKCSRYLCDDGSIHDKDAEFDEVYNEVYEEFGKSVTGKIKINLQLYLSSIGFNRISFFWSLITVIYHNISYHNILYNIISYHNISYHNILYNIISYHIILYHIILYHIISYYIISYYIISYYIISYHIISYYIILYHIISYYNISYHIILYNIISYHIISYHTISYHTISYHIII